jgi:hypothetical protein
MLIEMIVSGGQTGADRAALDVALEIGIPCGGWCPRGRRAEDGTIPRQYPLRQTITAAHKERTQRNVADSDGTLICNAGPLMGGTLLTRQTALSLGKPCLVVALDPGVDLDASANDVREWIESHGIDILNVAGPRASNRPDIYERTKALLKALLL